MSSDQQLPPSTQPSQDYPPQGQPPVPPPPRGTSGLAVAGLILAVLVAPIGLILSLIAIAKTGAGRAKGRGLAVTGVIVSALIMAGIATAIVIIANSTITDPGCVAGKAAILDNSNTTDVSTLKRTADQLTAAAETAKDPEVRAAVQTLADDYNQMLRAVNTGEIPPNLESKLTADGQRIDTLCTLGG